jgi:hypothetical protein
MSKKQGRDSEIGGKGERQALAAGKVRRGKQRFSSANHSRERARVTGVLKRKLRPE